MTTNLDLMNTLPPELFQQQQTLNRQQQLAQSLLQSNQQPQGQMVSGRYVAPSFFQSLAPVANMITGAYLAKQGDTKATELAKALRENRIAEGEAIMGAKSPDEQLKMAMQGYSPLSQQLATKLMDRKFREPKWEKSERTVDGMKETGFVNVNSDNPASTFVVGSRSPDIEIAKGQWEGYLPQTGGQGGQLPVNLRNNNPGNLVGADGKFLTFNTPQEGDNALVKDLSLKLSGQSPAYKARFGNAPVTPSTLAETWSPANAQGNSPESTKNYGAFIANKLGIAPNAPIPNTPEAIQIVKSAITQFESGAYGGQNPQAPKVSTTDAKYMPSNLPQYQYDPSISPKENAAEATKFSRENQQAIKNAKNSFDVLKSATDILNTNAPSSGRAENIITGTREFFGGGGEASKADAQLKIFGSKLTMNVPRFEGPQSDKDTALYQAAAGDVGNPNIPIASRLAAIQTMKDIAKKYYPNGDWDSIDTGGAVVRRNVLGGTRGLGAETMTPQQFAEGLSGEDKEAFNFIRLNPTDPRVPKIKAKLGID